jgi:hypothetical protein
MDGNPDILIKRRDPWLLGRTGYFTTRRTGWGPMAFYPKTEAVDFRAIIFYDKKMHNYLLCGDIPIICL